MTTKEKLDRIYNYKFDNTQDYIDRIKPIADELLKTLEWYADTSNHSPFSSLMREDCGERARQTLKGDTK